MSIIKDINLAPSGEMKINWVERNMPVLRGIGRRFSEEKPFKGLKVALSVHLEAKTAYLCRVMEMGGAEMYVTGSNPLSTQDDVAAALAAGGMNVFAEYGCTEQQYEDCLREVLKIGPNIIIDDGGDLVHLMHEEFADLIPGVIGGCEETTTGINRLRIMSAAGALRFPMVMVNDADCKHMFDNRYGTGQRLGRYLPHDKSYHRRQIRCHIRLRLVRQGRLAQSKGTGRKGHRYRNRPHPRARSRHGRIRGHAHERGCQGRRYLLHRHRRQRYNHRRALPPDEGRRYPQQRRPL